MKSLSSSYFSVLLRVMLLICCGMFGYYVSLGQSADTAHVLSTSVNMAVDSTVMPQKDTLGDLTQWTLIHDTTTWHTSLREMILHDPYYSFKTRPVSMAMQERVVQRDEFLFYWMLALFLMYAILKVVFPKYHTDLFKLFFRATLRQQQLREQLLQASIPSMFYNILFFISGGFFIGFWGVYAGLFSQDNLWPYLFYGFIGLLLLYLGKYVVIRFMGWVLHMERGADSYIFIVFLLNKVLGIFLLPCLLLMAFGLQGAAVDTVVKLSIVLIIGMYVYRFFISYQLVRSEIKLNLFHFFLYLCAFEVAPMLLLSKLLLKQL